MPHELDQILISSSGADFEKKLKKFRTKMIKAARFAGYGSEENQQVVEILRNVADRGDKAVAEYTKKFDGVRLTPEQFRVGRDELEKANRETICTSLKAVRFPFESLKMVVTLKLQKSLLAKSLANSLSLTTAHEAHLPLPLTT